MTVPNAMSHPHAEPAEPIASDAAIAVDGLGKRFDIYPNDRSRFLEFLGDRTHHHEHWAVRGVSFHVPRGRAFGVVGGNGAGKSTLLRLLAGITEPSEGNVAVRGRLATLLDLGVGFHETFTGRENIQLTCSLLGMRPDEIEARIPEIIHFAELGDFIDYPVRTYSTGMNLRLGFSVAVHADADVLLVDEVLAVGDQYFQRKCVRRIEQAVRDGTTLVLVSHDLHAVRSLCDEAIWLDGGRVRVQGPPREVVERYLDADRLRAAPPRPSAPPIVRPPLRPAEAGAPVLALPPRAPPSWDGDDPAVRDVLAAVCEVPDAREVFEAEAGEVPFRADGETTLVAGTGEARIVQVRLLDAAGMERERFRTGEPLLVAVTFRTTEPIERPIFGVALFRGDGVYVYGPNTRFDRVLEGRYHGVYTFWIHYPRLPLLAGSYRVSVAIYDHGHLAPHVWHNQLYGFEVAQEVEDHGIVHIPHGWGVLKHHEP
ncbi:MAG: ABC transporter ATP-binding protein [Myxococcota bacterium]